MTVLIHLSAVTRERKSNTKTAAKTNSKFIAPHECFGMQCKLWELKHGKNKHGTAFRLTVKQKQELYTN